MGFIKKIFGGIFALLGSILKIFGIGKKGEYFMELDEANAPTPNSTEAAGKAPAKVKESAPEPAMAAATQGKDAKEAATSPEPRVISQNTASSNPVQSKPVVETKPQMPTVKNFATDYLINPKVNNSPRRRPGPSVSPFKNMVREMTRKSPSMG